MKTLKIKNSTHKILKWIQVQEKLKDEKFTDMDAILFKALVQYANLNKMNLQALKEIVEIDDDK